MPLRDQTTMYGDETLATPADVEAYWKLWAQRRGFTRAGERSHQLRPSSDQLIANVSTGRWVADCPACGGGVALWSENPRACCLTCGTVYSTIDWPTSAEALDAATLLEFRDEANRSWRRDLGETLDDLSRENEAHDLPVAV